MAGWGRGPQDRSRTQGEGIDKWRDSSYVTAGARTRRGCREFASGLKAVSRVSMKRGKRSPTRDEGQVEKELGDAGDGIFPNYFLVLFKI